MGVALFGIHIFFEIGKDHYHDITTIFMFFLSLGLVDLLSSPLEFLSCYSFSCYSITLYSLLRYSIQQHPSIAKFFFNKFPENNIFYLLGHGLFFLPLVSSDQPKFLAFSKKKVTMQLNHFQNNSFSLKSEHISNSIEKNRNKNRNINFFTVYYVFCESKYM